ncbi:MAG: peptide ABC transporter substrate-binding protein [Pseudomonadota bacterium]
MRRLLLILAVVTAIVVIACQGDTTSSPDTTLTRANVAEVATLDPHRAEGVSAANVLRDLYEGLVAETPTGSLEPGAAERWEISEDGLTYRFYLRENGRWSNGDAVVAADFEAGIRRTADPATASSYAQILLPLENAAAVIAGDAPVTELGVEAIDERTLELRLERHTPYLLGLLTNSFAFPLHRASFAEYGNDFVRPENLVSNGAYQIDSWRVGDRLTVVRNANYRDADNVAVERVAFLPIEDTVSELNMFRAGELDITSNTPNTAYPQLRDTYGDQLVVHPNLTVYFYVFDMTQPPFTDARVREAVAIAVDRDQIAGAVLQAGQAGAWGLVPPGVDGYDSFSYEWKALPREQQIARARELYAAAGYSEDTPLQVKLLYNTSDIHKKLAVAVQGMLRENLGAVVELENQEWKVMLDNRRDRSAWDLLRLGWTGDYNDPYTFLETFRADHPQNTSGYVNAAYDALLDDVANELDPTRRVQLARDAERLLMREYPVLPMYFYVSKHLVSERVGNFVPNINDRIYSRHLTLDATP